MTADDLNELLDNITTDVDLATTVTDTAGVHPSLVPAIIMGRALEAHLPGLSEAIQGWMGGNLPTETEQAQLVKKLIGDDST